ncbi:hypothetical protein GJAV_G00068990 [Gymnothorax javanicus]|nr:hypothetical protein GJAV_G00068990 [Gymnothorax javanicus]
MRLSCPVLRETEQPQTMTDRRGGYTEKLELKILLKCDLAPSHKCTSLMAPTLLLFFSILVLSADAGGVTTVSNVAVQRGGSVTIPCYYGKQYQKHVKYWCQGQFWTSCRTIVSTNSSQVNRQTSIIDDPTHHVFTVTMTNLKSSGHYWCAVQIGGLLQADERSYLRLTVTEDTPGLWVEQQEVVGVEGGSVSVLCHYDESRSTREWCRAKGPCVNATSGKSGRSEITDERTKTVFNVTVRDLTSEDTGWYWCTAEELQIPVHISVMLKTTTTMVTASQSSASITVLSPPTAPATTNKPSTLTKPAMATEPSTPTKPETATGTLNSKQFMTPPSFPAIINYNKSPLDLRTLIPTVLGTLLLVLAVATVTWTLWKIHRSVRRDVTAEKVKRTDFK